jgi:hypothetical protein
MRRIMCAGYVVFLEEGLNHRNHNGISLFYYVHVLQRCGDAKYISIKKSTPTPRTDAGVALVSEVQCIISIKDSEGSMPVIAPAPMADAARRMKSKTKQDLPTLHPP